MTTEIARRHGHTGATSCQDCGTSRSVHYGSWFDSQTRESGTFLLCCTCGLAAGDPADAHDDCPKGSNDAKGSR